MRASRPRAPFQSTVHANQLSPLQLHGAWTRRGHPAQHRAAMDLSSRQGYARVLGDYWHLRACYRRARGDIGARCISSIVTVCHVVIISARSRVSPLSCGRGLGRVRP